jgi:hypothetical protein
MMEPRKLKLACTLLAGLMVCACGGGRNSDDPATAGQQFGPSAPTDLTAMTVAKTRIELGWADTSNNEDGLEIEQSLDGVDYDPLDTVAENSTSYSVTGC